VADRDDAPVSNSTYDLAELLRLHFEASRTELSTFIEQWAKNAFGNAVTIAVTIALAGLGGIFLLIAAVLAIGDALGHVGWGLLIVGGALALAGGGVAVARYFTDKNREAAQGVP
jgi:hypothetical protein